jgi:asparagine synthase (glutamine-hydrolysing)
MCGICGILDFDRRQPVKAEALHSMNAQLAHRGPDDEGSYVSGSVGLAMRRLSIIDLPSGHQPVTNEDRTIWLVYNGEIYNHNELRERLLTQGHRFETRSDTEVIVHLYEQYGRECVRHLRGMFAFVLWDAKQRVLFGARDRLGIKPFYYTTFEGRFLFASEIKALLAFPGVHAELNTAGIPEYLAFGYLSGEQTLFQGIRKLAPAHTLEVNDSGAIRIERYWQLEERPEEKALSFKDYVRGYREKLEEAVSSHLMSDVPLGVFLSGGVDSSAVAALMTRARRSPVQTFSVGYDEVPYSELAYARQVAKHIGSDHHEVIVSQQDFFDALPKVIWHEDEPIVWPSSVALYFVAKLAREHVTVVLTGEGSDETLAGYTRYSWILWNARLGRIYGRLVPNYLRRYIRGVISRDRWLSLPTRKKLDHSFLCRDLSCWEDFYFDNFFSDFTEAEQRFLLADTFPPGAAYRNTLAHWESSRGDLVRRMLYTDIHTYLVELLMKQDNVSMAASIESRVPFLDHPLVEYAYNIPSGFHTRGLVGKRILKRAVSDLLPHSILYRKKLGFPTPWEFWLSGPRLQSIEQLLLDPRSSARGLFVPEAVRRLFTEHRSKARDHATRIWRLLNLELWSRIFLDGDGPNCGERTLLASRHLDG